MCRILPGLLLVGLFAGTTPWARGGILLDLPNSGTLSASPGQATGWGFTLDFTDDPNGYFAVVTGSDFCTATQISPCSNQLGSYTDFVGSDQFVVLGPGNPTLTESYNLADQLGAGGFAVNGNAGPGQSVVGDLILTYDLYTSDPSNGGTPFASSLTVQSPASVLVSGMVSDAPEPHTGFLIFGVSALFLPWTRRSALASPGSTLALRSRSAR